MSTPVEGAAPAVILITAEATAICADGYRPGSIERGPLDAFAQGGTQAKREAESRRVSG